MVILVSIHPMRCVWHEKGCLDGRGGQIKCLFQSYKNIYLTGFNQCTIAQIRIKLTVYDDDIEICSKWQVSNKKPEAYLASGSKSLFSNRKTGLDHISLTIEFYINIYIIICIQRVCCFQFISTCVWPIIKKVTHGSGQINWKQQDPIKKGQRLLVVMDCWGKTVLVIREWLNKSSIRSYWLWVFIN